LSEAQNGFWKGKSIDTGFSHLLVGFKRPLINEFTPQE